MSKFGGALVIGILVLLAVLVPVRVGAQAYPVAGFSDRSYVDALGWKTHAGTGTICTLVYNTGRDTSRVFSLAGLRFMSAMLDFRIVNTGASTHTLVCSLEVSQDGTNWYRAAAQPLLSVGTLSDVAPVMRTYLHAANRDTALTATEVAGRSLQDAIGGSLYGRFIAKHNAADAGDTTFFTVTTHRAYRKR